jgi:predicted nucleic acid-binding protein
MTRYLLDTNILLRASDPSQTNYELTLQAIATILEQGDECVPVVQVLYEFWVVATRPVAVNGLGWTAEQTMREVTDISDRFVLLDDLPLTFSNWLRLVTTKGIIGKRAHDARIVATMQALEITHLLTLNPRDFLGMTNEIAIVHPQDV